MVVYPCGPPAPPPCTPHTPLHSTAAPPPLLRDSHCRAGVQLLQHGEEEGRARGGGGGGGGLGCSRYNIMQALRTPFLASHCCGQIGAGRPNVQLHMSNHSGGKRGWQWGTHVNGEGRHERGRVGEGVGGGLVPVLHLQGAAARRGGGRAAAARVPVSLQGAAPGRGHSPIPPAPPPPAISSLYLNFRRGTGVPSDVQASAVLG